MSAERDAVVAHIAQAFDIPEALLAQAGPDDEVAQQARNVADRIVALWREVHSHVSTEGCPNRAHVELLAWCERAEVDLHRIAIATSQGAR